MYYVCLLGFNCCDINHECRSSELLNIDIKINKNNNVVYFEASGVCLLGL